MRFIILAIIIAIAVGAGFFALQMTGESEPQQAQSAQEIQVATVNVFVARESISLGDIITEEMVDQQPWPQHLVLGGFVTAGDPTVNVVGMVARGEFQPQEPLNRNKLANPNDATFIAASLPDGMRAVTVAVDAISGLAGYVYPGDRVDVLLTHDVPGDVSKEKTAGSKVAFSEVLVPDVKVLAVDLRNTLEHEQAMEAQGQPPRPRAPTNITIQVTADEAQKIKLAEKTGALAMALRPLKTQEAGLTINPTALPNITNATVEEDKDAGVVMIVRGVKVEQSSTQPGVALEGQN